MQKKKKKRKTIKYLQYLSINNKAQIQVACAKISLVFMYK